jgi:cytochrome c553
VRFFLPYLALSVLAGCNQSDTRSLDGFAENGRVIAMSGAEAGASNACFTCHGLDGRGNGAGSPRLAGLDAGYLERQLEAYADGRRYHAQMRWITEQLTADERQAVARYYASMPFNTGKAISMSRLKLYHEGDAARGLPSCASCHGDRAEGIGAANPALAGQPPSYLAEQLNLWRKSRRRNDPGDVMLRISQLLTLSETDSLARYAATLPGGPPNQEYLATYPATRRFGPKSDASGPPLHVPESARAAE